MKFKFRRKNLIVGSLAATCCGITIVALSAGMTTKNEIQKDKNINTEVNDIVEVTDTEDIKPVVLKKYLTSSVSVSIKEEAEKFEAGTTELVMGMAGSFSQFIENEVSEETVLPSVDATIEEVDVVTKLEPEEVVSIVSGYTNLGVSDTGRTYLNVRKGPGTSYKKVGTMPSYSACEILETTDNGWYKIKSGDVEGYVSADYIATGKDANELAKDKIETVAVVTCKVLNVRVEPNTDCNVFTSVKKGEEVEIEEDLGDWLKININNLVGYVYAEYITYETKLPTAIELEEVTVTTNSKKPSKHYSSKDFASGEQAVSQEVKDLIDYALKFLGNPYVSGGNSLTKGTDCSGFTKLIFAKFGYKLGRTCKSQLSAGRKVSLSDVKPGDLLLYKYNGRIGHVAIYIGSGKIVHASTPRGGIKISNALYTTPAYAVRVIE